jgi:hypothetical protein
LTSLPQDLLNLQRVAGIGSYLRSLDAIEDETRKALQRARRAVKASIKADEADPDDPKAPIKKLQLEQVTSFRGYFEGRVVRRTPSSKRWDGKTLNALPDFEVHPSYLELRSEELDALNAIFSGDRYAPL